MSVPDWDLKRVYREVTMAALIGLVSFIAYQMADMKVIAQKVSVNDGRLEKHEGRIQTLEIDVNTLKVQTKAP